MAGMETQTTQPQDVDIETAALAEMRREARRKGRNRIQLDASEFWLGVAAICERLDRLTRIMRGADVADVPPDFPFVTVVPDQYAAINQTAQCSRCGTAMPGLSECVEKYQGTHTVTIVCSACQAAQRGAAAHQP